MKNVELFTITAYRCVGIGALLLALGIAAGAFGAHALKNQLDAYALAVYEKAVFYQLLNGLGMVALGVAAATFKDDAVLRPALLIAFGIIVFSGTLYGLTLFGQRWLGAVTPIGGTALIVGWLWVAILYLRK